jgi:O-antigen ligase
MKTSFSLFACLAAVGYACILGGLPDLPPHVTVFFLLVVVFLISLKGPIEVKKDSLILFLFSLVAVASILYARFKWVSILYSGSLLSGALLYIALRSSQGWQEKVIYTLVFCGAAQGIIALFQAVQVGGVSEGLFYNPNAYSGFLTPLVTLAAYLFYKQKKMIFGWATAFLIFSNLLSFSRAGTLSMLLALLVLVIYLLKCDEKQSALKLAVIVVAATLAYGAFSYGKDAVIGARRPAESVVATGLLEKGSGSIVQKVRQVPDTLKLFQTAPVLGHGINSYRFIIPMVANPYISEYYVHAHNLFLNILAELGLLGLLLFLFVLFLVLHGTSFTNIFFFKVALFSFLFHNLVEYNFATPPFQVLFPVLCALIMGGRAVEPAVFKIEAGKKVVALFLVCVYYLTVFFPPVLGGFYLRMAKEAMTRSDVEAAISHLHTSNYFGYSVSRLHQITASVLSGIYFQADNRNESLKLLIEQKYTKALSLDTSNKELYVEAAQFYQRTGRPEVAEKYLIDVTTLFPYDQESRLQLARFYRVTGRHKEAIPVLGGIEAFLIKFAPADKLRISALLELGLIYADIGEPQLSRDVAARAEEIKERVPKRGSN